MNDDVCDSHCGRSTTRRPIGGAEAARIMRRAEAKHARQMAQKPRPDIAQLVGRLTTVRRGTRAQYASVLNDQLSKPFVAALQRFGTFYPGDGARLKLGKPNDCHNNVRRLIEQHGGQALTHMTGLALSPDGIWRIHSWAQSPRGIVETMVLRTLYFGMPASLRIGPWL